MRVPLVAVIVALVPAVASAQAWLPQQGEAQVSFIYTDTLVREHYLPDVAYELGEIESGTFFADVTYGIRDDLAVSVGVPIVRSKYTGAFPHPTSLDNGEAHTSVQDLKFDVRYQLTRGSLVLTPFIGSQLPATDYEYFAHTAPGRRLRELQMGTYVGGTLDRALPGLFVQGRYTYGIVEEVLDISHNRSQLGLELGYFVTPSWRVVGMASGQRTHGGVDMPRNAGTIWPREQFRNHDRITAEHYVNLGGGMGWTVNDTFDVFGSLTRTVVARNTHKLHYAASVGVSITLRKPVKDPFSAARREGLVRCICQKASGGRMMGG
jgi:hypothetical protein